MPMWQGIVGACTVVGGVAALWQVRLWAAERMGRYGWSRVERSAKQLVIAINHAGYAPELIVGLGRGGFIVAGMLSGNMRIIPLAGLDRQYRWRGNSRTVQIFDAGHIDVSGKRVLLVEAEPYSGETLRMASDYLVSRGASEVKTAALFKAEVCNFVPDWFAHEVTQVTWVPWRWSDSYPRDSTDPHHHAQYLH